METMFPMNKIDFIILIIIDGTGGGQTSKFVEVDLRVIIIRRNPLEIIVIIVRCKLLLM